MDLFAPEFAAETMAALDDIAAQEPDTVSLARRIVTDAAHAATVGPTERRCAWILLASLRRQRIQAAQGTAA